MKRIICLLILFACIHSAQAQYLPVVKQDRVWYSFIDGWFDGTMIVGVGPDTTFGGKTLPLLVRMDQNMTITDRLATLEEDTTAGILKVEFFNGLGYALNFSAQIGDSTKFDLLSGDSAYLRVVKKYNIVDFRGVTRRALELQAPAQPFCNAVKITIVEGLGPLGSLVNPNHDCSVSDIPRHTLRCVFDGGEKIYGDTVQQCFVLDNHQEDLTMRKVFPNPATRYLMLTGFERGSTYAIHAVSGEKVQAGILEDNRIPVDFLPGGIYMLKVPQKGGLIYFYKFTKP